MTVQEIYDIIDCDVPFASAMNWDNCGILAGDPCQNVDEVLLALDISVPVIEEAHRLGIPLIISHHPVIFTPLKAVYADSPVGLLLRYDISAICTHTPFDMAPKGMNKGLYDRLAAPLGLTGGEPLEDMGDGRSLGMIYDLASPLPASDIAKRAKAALGCTVVRYTDGGGRIGRIAICSGSGGSEIGEAAARADALLSGDFKHSCFIEAENMGLSIFDCGHYHTEIIFTELMRDILSPHIRVRIAESSADPAMYE
ncbi:MAG: Nif3-like dinuclear metal center hexameric protein [Oscillospiraceae bacterium]|nr:Nif3-like dinuclear metal center hexameric protein [Oscillospiraceae bacterium]